MHEKSKCIVLHTIPYKDSVAIVHLFSEKLGRIACFLSISRSKKSAVKANLFQPLSILELEIYVKGSKEIYQIKEAKTAFPLIQIYTNPIKSALAMFTAEFLFRIVREQEQNASLYQFIETSIHILELSDKGIANFHLVFLLKFTAYLGFYPHESDAENDRYFDLLNGVFVAQVPIHSHYLKPDQTLAMAKLLRINYENMGAFAYNRQQRHEIITQILDYYRLHLTSFPVIKSLDVLKLLF
jgi:DNA repair protein RecO (recombination protein O)